MSAGFPETHWSRLLQIGAADEAKRAEILEWFAKRYWKPVYHYVRALRHGGGHEPEDLTQQFFAMLVERHRLEALSPERGSVRGFLKVAVRNFVTDADRSMRAQPRTLPFEQEPPGSIDGSGLPPEAVFDRVWLREILAEAVPLLRRQLAAEGRDTEFDIFEAYSLGDEPVTYDELARRFEMKPEDVRNRVRDARRRMLEIIRGIVSEYLGPGADVRAEVFSLIGS